MNNENSTLLYTYANEKDTITIKCPSCETVCLDPIIMKCCGTYYCRECIMSSGLESCLACNKPINKTNNFELDAVRDKFVIEKFFNPIVRCTHCWKCIPRGLLGELFRKHYNDDCVVSCPNDPCDAKLVRSALTDHRKECMYETVLCNANDVGCQVQGLRKDIHEHESVCLINSNAIILRNNKNNEIKIINLEQKVQYLEDQLSKLLNVKKPTVNWPGICTSNGILTNNNMTCTVVGNHGDLAIFRGSQGWNSGIHQWIVDCDIQEASVMIGITTDTTADKSLFKSPQTYLMYTSNGCVYNKYLDGRKTNPPLKTQYGGGKYKIKVRLDCDKRILYFSNQVFGQVYGNGSDIWSIGFEMLDMTLPYYPIVELTCYNHGNVLNPNNSVTYIPE